MSRMVLVTGGGGYIGAVLIPKLLEKGYRVRLYDTFYFGKSHLRDLTSDVEIVKGDIRRPSENIFNRVSTVIHLAAFSNDPMANFAPKLNFSVNSEATDNLARLAKKNKISRFIFASSCSIYHLGDKNGSLKNESSKVYPKEHYSKSKYLAEKAILPLADGGFAVTVLRKGTVVGYSPRMRFDLVVNTMVKTAFAEGRIIVYDGTQHRPLIDINDVADAYLLTMSAPVDKINGQVFNVLRQNYTILKLAQRIARIMKRILGKDIPIEVHADKKDRTYRVSTAKIKKVLGFAPQVSMKDSVVNLVSYIKDSPKINFDDPNYYNIKRMKQIMKQAKGV